LYVAEIVNKDVKNRSCGIGESFCVFVCVSIRSFFYLVIHECLYTQ
jgi:hypothetical protein